MSKLVNLQGKTFWRLFVVSLYDIVKWWSRWLCKCECWKEKIIRWYHLWKWTNSCGCLQQESRLMTDNKYKTHWMTNDRLFSIYYWILGRCNKKNKNHKDYKNYVLKWIKCLRKSFEEFKIDMYESYLKHVEEYWEKQTTIDRIDDNKDYCKNNCRWVTYKENNNNRKCTNKILYKWEIYNMVELSGKLWIPRSTLYHKIYRWEFVPVMV